MCTLEMRSTLSGEVRDRAGNTITPDAVERVGPGSRRVPCDIRQGGYVCQEAGSGRARVTVKIGDDSWAQPIRIRATKDGCHDADQELDFTLPELTPCTPRDAVAGALIDLDGAPISQATVRLYRRNGSNPVAGSPLSPGAECAVEAGRYHCPALNYYSDAEYELRIELQDTEWTAMFPVHAQDCQVDTVERDFDMRTGANTGG